MFLTEHQNIHFFSTHEISRWDIKYIQNQEKHHQKRSFEQEYLEFLKAFEIEYDENYLFKLPE